MGKSYVSFALGAERFCLPVEHVVQIVRRANLISIPRPLPYVAGAINLRGDVVPVLDLRPRPAEAAEVSLPAGGTMDAAADYRRRVIITRLGGRLYGLDVDEVREIVECDDASIAREAVQDGAPGSARGRGLVAGVARCEGGEFLLLDLARALDAGPRSGVMAAPVMDEARLRRAFLEEAEDLSLKLGSTLQALDADRGNPDLINEVFRFTHSLKSESALMGFSSLSSLAHGMEDVLGMARDASLAIDKAVMDRLYAGADLIAEMMGAIGRGGRDTEFDSSGPMAALSVVADRVRSRRGTPAPARGPAAHPAPRPANGDSPPARPLRTVPPRKAALPSEDSG